MKERLRQGEPLSPLLFVLIAEELNNMIRMVEQGGLLLGLTTTPRMTFINLQYANDTLIFGK